MAPGNQKPRSCLYSLLKPWKRAGAAVEWPAHSRTLHERRVEHDRVQVRKRALAVLAAGLTFMLMPAGAANAGDDQPNGEQELRLLRAENNLLKSTVEARSKEIAALKAELADLKSEVARLKAGAAQSQPVEATALSSATKPGKPPAKLTAQQLEARAAELLKKKGVDGDPLIYIKNEPGIGRAFVNVNLAAPINPGSPRLASQVYISVAEKGDSHLRLAVECLSDDVPLIRKLLFRLDKEDTEIPVPRDAVGRQWILRSVMNY